MNPRGGITEVPATMSQEQQYVELCGTVRCKLAPSTVHGIGVVALRNLNEGDRAYCSLNVRPQWYTLTLANLTKYFDKTYPEIKQLILDRWPNIVNGGTFLSPNYDARLISFMNHSDTPNYDPKTDLILRDVKAGEELFEDYRIMKNYELAFPWLGDKPDIDKKV